MSNIRLSEDMIGKEVRLVKIINSYNPDKIGAIGIIVDYDEADKSNMHYLVNWNFNGHEWETWPNDEEIEEVVENKGVKDDKEMTNEEIWEMLKPKMEKNGLKTYYRVTPYHHILSYDCVDAQKAIAIAYRSGYERAMKGRPFKFGEKKKGGHWEPIDPNNLPKEGTRVRYSRLTCDDNEGYSFSDWSKIQIGEETVVMYWNDLFGVKDIHNVYSNTKYISSCVHPERFDMWVDDDE